MTAAKLAAVPEAQPSTLDLDSMIPSEIVAETYQSRSFFGFSEMETFEAAMASGHNVMIYGPTGTGKTHAARAFAASKGLPFYTVACNGAIDMATLMGAWVPTEDRSLRWVDGVIPAMMREGRGVLLLDEINFAPERAIARLYGLLDSRREVVLYEHEGEVIRVPAGADLLIIAAYNPGYRGTRELSEALPNRFAFALEFDYSDEIEAELIPSPSLRELAGKLREMDREIRTPVSTNMLVELCEIGIAFSIEYALGNFIAKFARQERASIEHLASLYSARIEGELAEVTQAMEEGEG